jgi:hypothetical protein
MIRRAVALGALVGLIVPTVALTAAIASGSGFVDVVTDPGSAALHLMPGSDLTSEVAVHNESDGPASLRVGARNVSEDDHGCQRPEQAAGDTTCGDHGGELGHWLQLRIVKIDDASGDQQLWSGSLSDLAQGVDLLPDVAADDAPHLRLVTSLPLGATNETMSDGVSYDLVWTYTGAVGSTQTTVLAVHQEASGGASGTSFGLPGTGNPLSTGLLATIAALIAAGGMLLGHGRRRKLQSSSTL